MNMSKSTYKKYAAARAPHSRVGINSVCAFLCGGSICLIGEILKNLFLIIGIVEETASLLTTIILIFTAILLTAIGVFDKIAKHAGAGTLVPITGFANAVASSAIDAKAEGIVLGVGAKIFVIAGPVLLYGTLAGFLWGIVYFFTTL